VVISRIGGVQVSTGGGAESDSGDDSDPEVAKLQAMHQQMANLQNLQRQGTGSMAEAMAGTKGGLKGQMVAEPGHSGDSDGDDSPAHQKKIDGADDEAELTSDISLEVVATLKEFRKNSYKGMLREFYRNCENFIETAWRLLVFTIRNSVQEVPRIKFVH
jgi:hypothetical protein